MARRQTDEEKVVTFFQSVEYRTARTVANIVRGIMKQRAEQEDIPSEIPARPRKPRKAKKVNSVPPSQDSVTSAA